MFGVLLFASAGSFTSCKDYDDDINNLQGQIDGVVKDLNDLKTKVGTFVKSVSYDPTTGALTVVDANDKSSTFTIAQKLPEYKISVDKDGKVSLLKDGTEVSTGNITFPDAPVIPDAFDPSKLTLGSDGKVMYDGKDTGVTLPASTAAFDPAKLTLDTATGKLKYDGKDTGVTLPAVPADFDPSKLTLGSDGKVMYDGKDTGVTLPAVFDPSKLSADRETGKVMYDGKETNVTLPSVFDPSKLTIDDETGEVKYDGVTTGAFVPTDGVLEVEYIRNTQGLKTGWAIKYKDQTVQFTLSNDVLTLLVGLKSLVFVPELYVDGIEAIEYPYLDYAIKGTNRATTTTWNVGGVNSVVTQATADKWNYTRNVGNGTYNPIVIVKYTLNPSNAEVQQDDLSFKSKDVNLVSTRAAIDETTDRASVANPVVREMHTATNGILPVGLQAEGDEILSNGRGSMIALQAVVKKDNDDLAAPDTTVTSDYAMLYASQVDPRAIAFNDPTLVASNCPQAGKPDELYTTIGNAITNAATLQVAYNETLDLKEYLTIHYNRNGQPRPTANDETHGVWDYGEEADYGLHYDFEYIDYTTGGNRTSESQYTDGNITNGVVTPNTVGNDGLPTGQQGVSSIGKRPLVGVRVLDSQNRVVLVGFIKIEIVRQAVQPNNPNVIDLGMFGFSCNDVTPTMTWAQFSNEVLELGAVTDKVSFDRIYQLAMDGTDARQWIQQNNQWVEVVAANRVGAVRPVNDPTGSTNNVLEWIVNTRTQSEIFEANATDHSATVYVKYVGRGGVAVPDVYVALKLTVVKPQGTAITKLTNYWYEDGNTTRLNVTSPRNGGNTTNYVVNLNNAWQVVNGVNKPKFSPLRPTNSGYNLPTNPNPTRGTFDSYTDAILGNQNGGAGTGGYKYYFAAEQNTLTVDGTTYRLTVDNQYAVCIDGTHRNIQATTQNMLTHTLDATQGVFTNTTLYANGQIIARIDQATGNIAYENSNVAKILLNAFGHDDNAAGHRHFAKIGICAYSPCGHVMSLTNPTFDARFIRPIDAVGINGQFFDAQDNGSTLDIADLFEFEDWRDQKFKNGDSYGNVWYYAFYDISNVEVKLDQVTTDMSDGTLGTTLLSSKTTEIQLTQIDDNGANVAAGGRTLNFAQFNTAAQGIKATYDVIKTQMGKIKYMNNGNNVQSFKLRIPVEFTYTWGVVKAYVDVDVRGTMGN